MRCIVPTDLAMAALILLCAVPVRAQQVTNEDLKKQLDALTESIRVMQRDIQEIKAGMAARPAAPPSGLNVVLDLAGNRVKGPAEAAITLVEFTDYQCPFCARHVRDTWPKIDAEYVQTGKIRYVMLDLPLESIHKQAFKAAEAANCAGDQGKYWEMHDRLFENAKALEPWSAHAQALALDVAAFDACMASDKHAPEVRRDMEEARKVGITGTPGFFLARREPGPGSRVRTIAQIRGARPFEDFKAEIEKALAVPAAPIAK
jgi:protein-disulfide isomerase